MQRSSRHGRHFPVAAFLVLLASACTEPAAPYDDAAQFSSAGSAASAAPAAGFFPLDIQYSDPDLCAAHGGFPVATALSGNLKIASVQQRGGGVRIVEVLANGRIVLSANGRTLSSPLAGAVFYDVDVDNNLTGVTYVGLNGVFTVPRVGRIALETGRLVLDGTGAIVFESGPHDVFGSSPDVARLCGYLGA